MTTKLVFTKTMIVNTNCMGVMCEDNYTGNYPSIYSYLNSSRIGRRGGGVILYLKESIQAYEIKLEKEADCDEAVWCKKNSGNSKLTIGLVYV